MEDNSHGTLPSRGRKAPADREGGDEMSCEACGHDLHEHNVEDYAQKGKPWSQGLCRVCRRELRGGPCYPWEFR